MSISDDVSRIKSRDAEQYAKRVMDNKEKTGDKKITSEEIKKPQDINKVLRYFLDSSLDIQKKVVQSMTQDALMSFIDALQQLKCATPASSALAPTDEEIKIVLEGFVTKIAQADAAFLADDIKLISGLFSLLGSATQILVLKGLEKLRDDPKIKDAPVGSTRRSLPGLTQKLADLHNEMYKEDLYHYVRPSEPRPSTGDPSRWVE